MLVLNRKPGETIVVGDVVFTFLQNRGGSIRIGITAPAHVPIRRGEHLAAENSQAEETVAAA